MVLSNGVSLHEKYIETNRREMQKRCDGIVGPQGVIMFVDGNGEFAKLTMGNYLLETPDGFYAIHRHDLGFLEDEDTVEVPRAVLEKMYKYSSQVLNSRCTKTDIDMDFERNALRPVILILGKYNLL